MGQALEKLNMRQIAKLAGVSPATVSRILNGQCDGKANSHKRVRDVLRSNGYERKKRVPPKATFLCVNEYDEGHVTSHALKILAHLDEIASRRQCELLTIHTSDLKRITERTADSRISGVIYLGDVLPDYINLPSVILNRNSVNEECSSVDCDEILGLVMLIRHLNEIGHERIAYFSDTSFLKQSLQPRKSFEVMKAFSIAGVNTQRIWDFDLKAGEEDRAFKKIADEFNSNPIAERPTALVLCGDTYANFAYKVFSECGISIPKDLSVAAFDDEPFSARLSPPLTTVRKPLEAMCESAMELLFDAINNNDAPNQRVLLKPTLVERESVGSVNSDQ